MRTECCCIDCTVLMNCHCWYVQGYPPAQQPVTYTFEELQMMQQPQRFPVVSTPIWLNSSTVAVVYCFVNFVNCVVLSGQSTSWSWLWLNDVCAVTLQPYYDVPFHQPVTTMTGRDVAASLTGQSYSAGNCLFICLLLLLTAHNVKSLDINFANHSYQHPTSGGGS